MQLTSNESTFLEMIKKTCIDNCVKNKIAPSVVAVIGIVISNWGTSKEFFNTRNIYLLLADNNWYGRCYSKDSEKIYDRVQDCKESGAILYRVYDDHRDSIKDFISYLMESRRSENGPLRYQCIIGCTEYKDSINRLIRNGFMQSYLNRNDDAGYIGTLISIIEKYDLYNWDNLLKLEDNNMSKKKHHYNNNNNHNGGYNVAYTVNDEIENSSGELEDEEEVNDGNEFVEDEVVMDQEPEIEHMYRVRLDWDKRDTQIFSSPSYEDALESALQHEGYKIYIDDDGELFEDPWENYNSDKNDETNDGPKPIIHALQGEIIVLDNTPVYKSAIDKHPMSYMSGTYYFYDSSVINGRAKITAIRDMYKKNPNMILGYINI